MDDKTTTKKRSLGWRIARWCVIGLAGLVTLVALLWVEENWRGKRAWENFKREWEAKGEKFDLKDRVPPPVPNEQNFAMTPFLAPLFDFRPNRQPGESAWRDTNAVNKVQSFANDMGSINITNGGWVNARHSDLTALATALGGKKEVPASNETPAQRAASAEVILQKFGKYNPVLEELRTASARPYFRFNINYGEENPEAILLPHLSVLKKCSILYQLRASAELAAGKSDAALADVKMGLYLGEGLKSEPVLISGLVEVAIVRLTLQPIWEGLADHRWTDAQLGQLEESLGQMDMLRDYGIVMRGERAFNLGGIEYMRKSKYVPMFDENGGSIDNKDYPNLMPNGCYYQNELAIGQMYQDVTLPGVDAGKHRIYLELSTNANERMEKNLDGRFPLYTIFARMLFPAVMKAENKFASAQAAVDEAMLACALERYRLAHGEFPEKLDALSPQFINAVPMDLATGEPLKYRRTTDGTFILYSVGWNGRDDGGTVVRTKESNSIDFMQGDWVWRYSNAK